MSAPDTLFLEDAAGRLHPADPWTSKAAARAIAPAAGTARYRVLDALASVDFGLTDYELAGRLNMLPTAAGTRRKELADAGAVELVIGLDGKPLRRPTDTGRGAKVYTLTAAGREALQAARGTAPALSATDAPRGSGTPVGRPYGRLTSRRGLRRTVDLVLEALADAGARGLTDYELGLCTGLLRTAAGTYRKQLERAGHVHTTGRTRPTDRQQPATVHVVTSAGLEHLRELAG